MRYYLLFLIVPLIHVSDANAAVINADNHSAIAGTPHPNAVLDEFTNRLWLDVTESVGFSINQIANLLSSGQEFEGWQLPELSDVEELLVHANIPYPTSPPGDGFGSLPGFNQPISDFLDIFGSPEQTDLGDQADMWIQSNGAVPVVRIILSDGEFGSLDAHRAKVHISPPNFDHSDTVFGTVGTALFREVPEPSSLVLIAGLVCVAAVCRATRKGRGHGNG